MENSKYNIREICGDWALDIQWGKETIVLIFNSRNNAEFVKKILEWEDMHPNQAVPYVPVPQPGKPLTLDQLREMDGQPVWIEDVNRWGLVSIPEAGQFKNSPFVLFRKSGVQFEWLVEDSELTVCSYPPAHIDRSEWEPCDNCKKACWNCKHNLLCCEGNDKECDDCVNQSKWEFLAYQNYCPKCGRPLTKEAWAELERRLRMPEPPEEG